MGANVASMLNPAESRKHNLPFSILTKPTRLIVNFRLQQTYIVIIVIIVTIIIPSSRTQEADCSQSKQTGSLRNVTGDRRVCTGNTDYLMSASSLTE
jgi:hypothetical protein